MKEKFCSITYSLHVSHIRDFPISYPSETGPECTGVPPHEQEGADCWETPRDYCTHVHHEPIRIMINSHTNLKDAGKCVKRDKGAHQEEDGLGGSRLRGGLWGAGLMNVLHSLLVPVQDEHHGAAGPEHEPPTHSIRE